MLVGTCTPRLELGLPAIHVCSGNSHWEARVHTHSKTTAPVLTTSAHGPCGNARPDPAHRPWKRALHTPHSPSPEFSLLVSSERMFGSFRLRWWSRCDPGSGVRPAHSQLPDPGLIAWLLWTLGSDLAQGNLCHRTVDWVKDDKLCNVPSRVAAPWQALNN